MAGALALMAMPLRVVSDDETPDDTITVPATVEELSSTAEAFLSTGWTLAAAVWAWTYEGLPGGRKPTGWNHPVERYSISELADRKIRGLQNRAEVRKYRAVWQSAIDAGEATAVEPGETVVMPDLPFGLITPERDEPDPGPDDDVPGPETPAPGRNPSPRGDGPGNGGGGPGGDPGGVPGDERDDDDNPDGGPPPLTWVDVQDEMKAIDASIDRLVHFVIKDRELADDVRRAFDHVRNSIDVAQVEVDR